MSVNIWGTDVSLIDTDNFCGECERPTVEGHYSNCSQHHSNQETVTYQEQRETVIYGDDKNSWGPRVVVDRVLSDTVLTGHGTFESHGERVQTAIAEAVKGGWERDELTTVTSMTLY